jgi:hypothetical protein
MRTVEQLREALREANPDFKADAATKQAALEELAQHGAGATEALPEILAVAGHGHYLVTNAMIATLQALEPAAVVTGLTAGEREHTLKALFKTAMHFNNPGCRPRPLSIALRDTVPLLIEALATEEDEFTRSDATLPLAVFGAGDDRAFDALVEAAADSATVVREWVAQGLWHFGDRALPHLVKLMSDFGGADRVAVYATSRIATPAAIDALTKFGRANKRHQAGKEALDKVGSIAARAAKSPTKKLVVEQPAAKAKPAVARKPKKATAKATKKPANTAAAKAGTRKPANKATANAVARKPTKATAKTATRKPTGNKPAAKKPAAGKPAGK